ncbi:MAG: amidinotransferase [Acidobacteria bacterium]|nr:amidinotransferase [Acidobacteriota bacterium]
MLRNEGDRLRRVVVCAPRREYFSVKDLATHNIVEVADPENTLRQHRALQSLMAGCGCEVIDVPELDGHPNSVFPRDAALSGPTGYIKMRMGLPSRRGEEQWMARVLESLGEPCAGEIIEPGTVEGGDVILAGEVAFVGLSPRTNQEGVNQLLHILRGIGYEVRTAPVDSFSLHIGGMMSAIGPDRVLCCRDAFPPGFFSGFQTVEVPRKGPSTGNVICVGENEVIANAAENADTIRALEQAGVRVHGIDLSEFQKGSGGPTCLILPVARGQSRGPMPAAWKMQRSGRGIA